MVVRSMNITIVVKLYAVAVVTFFVIDLFWLGVVARSFYKNQMGHLLRADVNWAAAIVFYLIFVVGIVVLAVLPAIERQSLAHAIALGALLGLVTYAAYDLTNLATLEGFPFTVVLVDMVWGTVLCGSVSAVTYLASERLL
jgi:uncharacterized membrane protein